MFIDDRKKQDAGLKIQLVHGPVYDFHQSLDRDDILVEYCDYGYVSDALRYEIYQWNSDVAIAIFSDTGTGKNTFLEKVLIPDALKRNGKILYLSNRAALGRQEKRRLAKMFNMEYRLEGYTDKGLDALTDFGCIKAVSFQQLEAWLTYKSCQIDNLLGTKFLYVVVDEAHYFLSDSIFNATTDLSFSFITENFAESVKIYMTATPEEIFPILEPKETSLGEVWAQGYPRGYFRWHVYSFNHNYDGLQMHAFRSISDLLSLLRDAQDGKTVVFVDNKAVGAQIVDKMGTGVLITADSKDEENSSFPFYRQIVENETFDGRLLVCTAVLENGVNLKDPLIKHIVIFTNDKVRFLQMLGRVRREPEQILEVYVPDLTNQEITRKLNSALLSLEADAGFSKDPAQFYKDYVVAESAIVPIRHAFSVLPSGRVHLNTLARMKIQHFDLKFYKRIKSHIEEGDSFAGVREKFRWVNAEFCQDSFIRKQSVEDAFLDFFLWLNEQVGYEIPKEEQTDFCKTFSEKCRAAFGNRPEDKTKEQQYGLAIMKQILEKRRLPFVIENQRKGWILKRKEISHVEAI